MTLPAWDLRMLLEAIEVAQKETNRLLEAIARKLDR